MFERVEAVLVNHNTSLFAELAVRTFVACHRQRLDSGQLRLTVVDNHSTDDDREGLVEACAELGVGLELSRWPAATAQYNSHGEVLRDFVLAHPEADVLVFIDADIVFAADDTVGTMVGELNNAADLWAVQARFDWSERSHGAGASLDIQAGWSQEYDLYVEGIRCGPFRGANKPRCHPGCVAIANSTAFRSVAEFVGLSTGLIMGADETQAGFADTLGLASLAMRTHGLRYDLSSATVCHYFGVSYGGHGDELLAAKREECQARLNAVRRGEAVEPGPWG